MNGGGDAEPPLQPAANAANATMAKTRRIIALDLRSMQPQTRLSGIGRFARRARLPGDSLARPPGSPARRSLRSRPGRARPARIQRLGVRDVPTPAGVPVATMSPGSSVITADSSATSRGMPNTSCDVDESCSVSPSIEQRMRSACGSGISSRVTSERTARAVRVEHFAERPLRRAHLVVAHADVVEARVARDHAVRVRFGDVLRARADHERELRLVVDAVRLGAGSRSARRRRSACSATSRTP